jgi:serine/threonine-protein kinase HipA
VRSWTRWSNAERLAACAARAVASPSRIIAGGRRQPTLILSRCPCRSPRLSTSIRLLLRTHSTARDQDIRTFLDALAFNWLTGGTDAHAKNYSLLIGHGGRVRLAPLYDLASVLPYEAFDQQRVKLAMKLGGKYRLRDIAIRQWTKLASDLRLNVEATVGRVMALAEALPDLAHDMQRQAQAEGLPHPVVARLVRRLSTRAKECARRLQIAGG